MLNKFLLFILLIAAPFVWADFESSDDLVDSVATVESSDATSEDASEEVAVADEDTDATDEEVAVADEDMDSEARDLASKKIKKTYIKRLQNILPKTKDTLKVQPKKKVPLSAVKPPAASQHYYPDGTDEAELEETINQEIAYLYKLYKKKPTSDITLRLGSIYVEKAKLISFKLQLDHEKALQAYQTGTRKTRPTLNTSKSKVYNRKALALFQDLRNRFPKHKRMDEILFFLGFNAYQLGQRRTSIKYFQELENRFPKSEYLYEAWFQLGEYYFENRKWASAFKYYSKIAKNKKGKFYFLSVYKMAWTYYKRGQVTKGLKLLEKIIVEASRANRKQSFTFVSEATQDLVLFYTYSSQSPALAKKFFLKVLDDDLAWKSLKKLAYAYRDTGNVKGTRILFSQLIEYNPLDKQAFDYKYQIVNTAYNSGSVEEMLKEFKEWVNDYSPSSNWARANSKDKVLIEKSANLIETTLRNYALKNHQTYRISRNKKELQIALSLYEFYFSEFKNSKYADQVFFFYGELLFDSRQYAKAVTAYELVIKNFGSSKYAKPAYRNQLLAAEKQLPKFAQLEAMGEGKKNEVDVPKSLETFEKIASRYITKYPSEENVPTVLYRLGVYYYKLNHFSIAGKYMNQLFNKHPNSDLISSAGSILLDIYNKNEDYKALEVAAVKFAENKNLDKELVREARFILEQISFKKAQDLALNKKYKEAADLYREFAKKNSGGQLALTSFYNAAINYEKAEDFKAAVEMYSSVLTYKAKRNDKVYKKAAEFLPALQEKLGMYRSAANGYTYYAKTYPNSPKAVDYWYNASLIFDAFNMLKSASYTYNQYYALNKTAERHEALYLLGVLHARFKQWNSAIAYYKKYLNSGSKENLNLVKTSYDLAKIYEDKLKNKGAADYWYKNTLKLYKAKNAGVFYGADSHFREVYKIYLQFRAIKIPKATSQQKQAVDRKIQLLGKLETNLRPVIRYNDGSAIISSLALIGLANQEMAEAIYNAPIPGNLDAAGKKQYQEGIKKLIQPYIKKSIESYEAALDRAKSFKVYNEKWIGLAYEGLFSIETGKSSQFESFNPYYTAPETLRLVILDNKQSLSPTVLNTLSDLTNNVSKEDFVNLAKAIKNKEEPQVIEAASTILNKDPDNVLALHSLALFYLQKRKTKMASLLINRALSKNKKEPVLLNNMGVIALRSDDYREAFTYFRKSLDMDRNYHIAQLNLAYLFLQNEDYYQAYSLYKEANGKVFKGDSSQNYRFLNNFGASLIGIQKWKTAYSIFKKLSSSQSPHHSMLLNYSLVLINGLQNKNVQKEVQGLVSEMELYSKSVIFKQKLDKIKKQIGRKFKK